MLSGTGWLNLTAVRV